MNDVTPITENPVKPPVPTAIPEKTETKKTTRLSSSAIKEAADTLAESSILPRVPGYVVQDPVQFDEWIKLLTVDQFNRLMIYAYRQYPLINRKLPNPDADNYIDIITSDQYALSNESIRDCVKANHGGGKFKLHVNDTALQKKQTIMEVHIAIPLDECEPKLNFAEVDLVNPKNAGYIQVLQQKGLLDERKRWVQGASSIKSVIGPTAAPIDNSSAINVMAGMVDKLFTVVSNLNKDQKQELGKNGINEIFLEKLKQESPSNQISMMSQMMGMFEKILNKPQDTSNQVGMKEFLTMMNDSNNKMILMMQNHSTQMMEVLKDKGSNKEPESDLDKLVKWKTLMPEMFGGKRQTIEEKEPETWAGVFKGALSEIGLPLLGIASQLLQMKGANPIIPVTPGQARDMVQPQAMITQPGTSKPIGENVTNTPQSNVVPINANANAPVQRTLEDLKNEPNFSPMIFEVMTKYGMFFVNALKADNPGEVAGEQVAGMTQMLGANIYQMIKGQGEEKIVGTMKLIPEFWNMTGAVYGEDHIKDFVNRFCNFEKYLDENDDEGNEGADIGEGRKE